MNTARSLSALIKAAAHEILMTDWVWGDINVRPPEEVFDAVDYLTRAERHMDRGQAFEAYDAILNADCILRRIGLGYTVARLIGLLEAEADRQMRTEIDLCPGFEPTAPAGAA